MPRSKPPLFYIYLLGFLKKKEKFNLRHFRQIYLADLAQHLWGVIVPQKHTLFWPPCCRCVTDRGMYCVCMLACMPSFKIFSYPPRYFITCPGMSVSHQLHTGEGLNGTMFQLD